MKLAMDRITVDMELQARAGGMNDEVVTEYAGAWRTGALFPAVVVFKEENSFFCEAAGKVLTNVLYWLADGFHRLFGAKEASIHEIECDVRLGGRREALLYALGANATHGLKRSAQDKRRAVELLLQDPEWALWSDRVIAGHAKVSHIFVGKVRRECGPTGNVSSCEGPTGRKGSDGRVRKVSVAGRTAPAADAVAPKLDALHLATVVDDTLGELVSKLTPEQLHWVSVQLRQKADEIDPEAQEREARLLREHQAQLRKGAKKK